MVTATGDVAVVAAALAAGADDVLYKPTDVAILVDTVTKIMRIAPAAEHVSFSLLRSARSGRTDGRAEATLTEAVRERCSATTSTARPPTLAQRSRAGVLFRAAMRSARTRAGAHDPPPRPCLRPRPRRLDTRLVIRHADGRSRAWRANPAQTRRRRWRRAGGPRGPTSEIEATLLETLLSGGDGRRG